MSGSGEERTEKATPKKLRKSRKEGQVARSPELGAWAAVLLAASLLPAVVGYGMSRVQQLLATATRLAVSPDDHDMGVVLLSAGRTVFVLALLMGTGVMVVGVASAVAQGGLFFATAAVKPKWSRLNPLQGAKRIFGPQAGWQLGKMLMKSALVAFFVWRAVVALLPMVGGLVPLTTGIDVAASAALSLMRDAALAGLVAAAADYAVQRRRTGKQVRMTKKEVRDEHRQSEGDPHLKGALRSRQLAAARNRMMADVPLADVVLVNPTHVAVALRYEPEKGTPRVVAKGAGVVAAKIRETAREHRVSIVEDVPLARALHGACEVGQQIPPPLYQAVAQVLAYVLSVRAAGAPAGWHRTPRSGEPLPDVPRAGRRTPGQRPARRPGEPSAKPSRPAATGR